MTLFSERLRYAYPLTEDSLVIDVGGYEGNFAREIAENYRCQILCFEPVFYERIEALNLPNVKVIPAALGAFSGYREFGVSNDSTGKFSSGAERVVVPVIGLEAILKEYPGPIGLLKLNCEGMEYEILQKLVQMPDVERVANIQ